MQPGHAGSPTCPPRVKQAVERQHEESLQPGDSTPGRGVGSRECASLGSVESCRRWVRGLSVGAFVRTGGGGQRWDGGGGDEARVRGEQRLRETQQP